MDKQNFHPPIGEFISSLDYICGTLSEMERSWFSKLLHSEIFISDI